MSRKVINVIVGNSNNNIVYKDISSVPKDDLGDILQLASLGKINIDGQIAILPSGVSLISSGFQGLALAFIMDLKAGTSNDISTIGDIIASMDGIYNSLPTLTEEQFYDLTVPTE